MPTEHIWWVPVPTHKGVAASPSWQMHMGVRVKRAHAHTWSERRVQCVSVLLLPHALGCMSWSLEAVGW